MSSSKNLEYQKTSFLSKSNSAFIEEMYLKFINKDTDLPESWKKYFSQIGEELDINFTITAAKPSKKSIETCLKILNTDRKQAALIGDRVFTDVIAGNRSGIYTILVKQIGKNGRPKVNNLMQRIEISLAKFIRRIKL